MSKRKLPLNAYYFAIGLIVVVAAGLIFFPSNKQRKDEAFKRDFYKTAVLAGDADVARMKSATEFVIPAQEKKKADLYLFVPALNNHIAFLAKPHSKMSRASEFKEFDIHVLPTQEKNAPATNLAIKLALTYPGAKGQVYIDEVSQHPTTCLPMLESAWSQVPKETQTVIESRVAVNLKLANDAGKAQCVVIYGSFKFKAEEWFSLHNPIFNLREFYHTN